MELNEFFVVFASDKVEADDVSVRSSWFLCVLHVLVEFPPNQIERKVSIIQTFLTWKQGTDDWCCYVLAYWHLFELLVLGGYHNLFLPQQTGKFCLVDLLLLEAVPSKTIRQKSVVFIAATKNFWLGPDARRLLVVRVSCRVVVGGRLLEQQSEENKSVSKD